jgi:chromosomal replication initiator protein
MFLARERTAASLPELGRAFRRDHTSVLHAVRKLRADLADDPSAVLALEFLRRRLDEQQSREESLLLQLPMLEQASGR